MALQGKIRTDCGSHRLEDVEQTIYVARQTGNKARLEKALRYRSQGKKTVDLCGSAELITCEGCKEYHKAD